MSRISPPPSSSPILRSTSLFPTSNKLTTNFKLQRSSFYKNTLSTKSKLLFTNRNFFCTQQHVNNNNGVIPILKEDEDYLFVYKPSGIPLMRDEGTQEDGWVFHDKVLKYTMEKNYSQNPIILNKIEKPSAGIIAYAKNADAASDFHHSSKTDGVNLIYIAICNLLPKARLHVGQSYSTLEHGILLKGKDKFQIVKKGVGVDVKSKCRVVSVNTYKTSSAFPEYYEQLKEMGLEDPSSFVDVVEDENVRKIKPTKDSEEKKEVRKMQSSHFYDDKTQLAMIAFKPITNRKSQIRATCSYLHAPIVGDSIYYGINNCKDNKCGNLLGLSYMSFLSKTGKLYEIACNPNELPDPLWRGVFSPLITSFLVGCFAKNKLY